MATFATSESSETPAGCQVIHVSVLYQHTAISMFYVLIIM